MFNELLDGIALDSNSDFMAEDGWVTIHPQGKGKNADYQRVYIDDDGVIQAGLGEENVGKKASEFFSKKSGDAKETEFPSFQKWYEKHADKYPNKGRAMSYYREEKSAFLTKEKSKADSLTNTEKTDKIRADEEKETSSKGEAMTETKPITTRQDKLQKTIDRYRDRLAKFDIQKETEKELKQLREQAKWNAEFQNLPMPSEDELLKNAQYWTECKRQGIVDDMNRAIEKMPEAQRLDAKETEKVRKQDNKSVFIAKLPPVLKEFRTAFMVDYAEALKEGRKEAKEWLKDNRDFPSFPKWYEKRAENYANKDHAYASYKAEKSGFWNTYENQRQQANMTDDDIDAYAELGANECVFGLVRNVNKAVGKVTNLDDVRVTHGSRGQLAINGIVSGENGKCRVESITAGGYNIQRFHIRVLVHKIKEKK